MIEIDPVANMLNQRILATRILAAGEGEPIQVEDAYYLAELVVALDQWRRQSGFDPYLAQPEILR